MFPELFDHSQAEDVGDLCVHRKTGSQDVSILRHRKDHQNQTFLLILKLIKAYLICQIFVFMLGTIVFSTTTLNMF